MGKRKCGKRTQSGAGRRYRAVIETDHGSMRSVGATAAHGVRLRHNGHEFSSHTQREINLLNLVPLSLGSP